LLKTSNSLSITYKTIETKQEFNRPVISFSLKHSAEKCVSSIKFKLFLKNLPNYRSQSINNGKPRNTDKDQKTWHKSNQENALFMCHVTENSTLTVLLTVHVLKSKSVNSYQYSSTV